MSNIPGFTTLEGREPIDLQKTLECGQVFRFNNITGSKYLPAVLRERRPGHNYVAYFLVSSDKACIVAQNKEGNPAQLEIACNRGAQQVAYWVKYFGIHSEENRVACEVCAALRNPKLVQMAQFSRGIHILNQNPWEMLVSFIISQRNNIPKIKTTITKLCRTVMAKSGCTSFGAEYFRELGVEPITWYPFPSAEDLHHFLRYTGCWDYTADYGKLAGIGLGYRDSYIASAVEKAMGSAHNKTYDYPSVDAYFQQIRQNIESGQLSTAAIRAELESYFGVGPKVAQCVALFGFGCTDMFPVDVWIDRALPMLGPGLRPELMGRSAGLIQQYIYYYMINHR